MTEISRYDMIIVYAKIVRIYHLLPYQPIFIYKKNFYCCFTKKRKKFTKKKKLLSLLLHMYIYIYIYNSARVSWLTCGTYT